MTKSDGGRPEENENDGVWTLMHENVQLDFWSGGYLDGETCC